MNRILIVVTTLVIALTAVACGDPSINNANANVRPVNAGNSTNANAAAPNTAAAESEVRKIIDTTQAALGKNDADAMDKIYAENYMTVNTDGSIQTKAERLASLRSGEMKYDSFAFSDINIRVNSEGNGAVAITRLTMKGMFKGKPLDGSFRVTGIYSKTKDGWKLAGSQSTKIEGDSTGASKSNTNSGSSDGNKTPPAANK